MSTYETRDAQRIIPMVSDDAGATWYPKGGNPALAVPFDPQTAKVIRLSSGDLGLTWTDELP